MKLTSLPNWKRLSKKEKQRLEKIYGKTVNALKVVGKKEDGKH